MNTRGKKGTKTDAFETEQLKNNSNALENLQQKNRYWSAFLYELLTSKEFLFTDKLIDLLNEEIGISRTSRIFDLSLLLLERNYPTLFDEYKSREGVIFKEQ
jgi:hypothetical protein